MLSCCLKDMTFMTKTLPFMINTGFIFTLDIKRGCFIVPSTVYMSHNVLYCITALLCPKLKVYNNMCCSIRIT